MNASEIVSAIDAEIARLKQARELLVSIKSPVLTDAAKRSPGRPKGSTATTTRKKRVLSEEARARIAAAQKKRWAAKSSQPADAEAA